MRKDGENSINVYLNIDRETDKNHTRTHTHTHAHTLSLAPRHRARTPHPQTPTPRGPPPPPPARASFPPPLPRPRIKTPPAANHASMARKPRLPLPPRHTPAAVARQKALIRQLKKEKGDHIGSRGAQASRKSCRAPTPTWDRPMQSTATPLRGPQVVYVCCSSFEIYGGTKGFYDLDHGRCHEVQLAKSLERPLCLAEGMLEIEPTSCLTRCWRRLATWSGSRTSWSKTLR